MAFSVYIEIGSYVKNDAIQGQASWPKGMSPRVRKPTSLMCHPTIKLKVENKG